ncbi:unnamed protein product, partial [Didymodactylos carnosus]
ETIATNTILIMWSKGVSPEDWLLYSDQEYWSPNHYVPLLKPRETEGDYLQATYSVAKAIVEIKQKKEPSVRIGELDGNGVKVSTFRYKSYIIKRK